jgi:phosphoribosyl 1,2-cyclic phosphate phosphodiesterase
MKITILGCGTSGGVPRIGNQWGDCDPTNPKNRRRRVSILVNQGETQILVDTSPDMREQCLDAGVDRLDAVLYTHEHADHTHGIDELRPLSYLNKKPINVYGSAETLDGLKHRFKYAFVPLGEYYRPIVEANPITGPFSVGEIEIIPFSQVHGGKETLGFRFGSIAYSTDLVELPEKSFNVLAGIDTWIVDALQKKPHPTHTHLAQTLEWIERVKPRRAILTHMALDMDYDSLVAELPAGVEPGYDGMEIDLPDM